MKKIIVLGSGLVSRPGVRYLLELEDTFVTVASNILEDARSLVEGYENGKALFLDVKEGNQLREMIADHDVVVSLLPWVFHVQVAELCLELGKHMATASYVSEDMRKLDARAKDKGLLFLNELGLDPGIDHMSAMKIITEVEEAGGKVVHFYSFCGGLPAPQHNDNPFGYKFSWSPLGVLRAGCNSARFLENGKVVEIEGQNLFLNYREEEIPGLGKFEVYPNRDSMPYIELYGLAGAETVMRGTYRYPGWCKTLKAVVDLGLIDETPVSGLKGNTFAGMIAGLVGASEGEDVKAKAAEKLGLAVDDPVLARLEWLGLFSGAPLPGFDNYLENLGALMEEKLVYKEGEQDMILLQHQFIVEKKDKTRSRVTSTMIDYGIPGGDSSMARTVSLPLAIGVRLMAEGKIPLTGVHIPNRKEIYQPVLDELETLDIKMEENESPLE